MLMQIVNVVFWMLPHAVILSVSCSWFGVIVNVSGLIRWTMWNTVSDRFTMPLARKTSMHMMM